MDEEREEIEAALRAYPQRQAGVVEALKVVQGHRRWISDDALRDIAALLNMAPAEVDGVATFYNLIFRKPVGRHVILVCDSVSCWMLGYGVVLAHLKSRLGIDLGETTSDGRFTLLPNVCLGACDHAPTLMVDEDLYGDVDSAMLEAVLERYL